MLALYENEEFLVIIDSQEIADDIVKVILENSSEINYEGIELLCDYQELRDDLHLCKYNGYEYNVYYMESDIISDSGYNYDYNKFKINWLFLSVVLNFIMFFTIVL